MQERFEEGKGSLTLRETAFTAGQVLVRGGVKEGVRE